MSKGESTYRTGKPCPRGHMAARFVSNSGCEECLRLTNRQHQAKNRDKLLPLKREWAKKNPEKNRAQSNAWQAANRERALEIQRRAKQKKATHYRALGRVAAAKRRAAQLQRTPAWSDPKAIEAIYTACPSGMEVDHIVPLQGRTVSGLHVPNNLQYLTKSENSGKGAKWQ